MDATYQDFARIIRTRLQGEDLLFHGTRYPLSILGSRALRRAPFDLGVSLTRSPEVAAYWAEIERDNDERMGAVFALDRRALRSTYRLEPYHSPMAYIDEMEEVVWRAEPLARLRAAFPGIQVVVAHDDDAPARIRGLDARRPCDRLRAWVHDRAAPCRQWYISIQLARTRRGGQCLPGKETCQFGPVSSRSSGGTGDGDQKLVT